MPRHQYPCIIAILDGADALIKDEALAPTVFIRNPMAEEIQSINSMAKQWIASRALRPLDERTVMIEVAYEPPKHSDYAKWQAAFAADAERVRTNTLTLLRLAGEGPVTTRLLVLPLADLPDPGYSMATIGYIPALRRMNYPLSYPISNPLIAHLFRKYWSRELSKEPGVRWLNKAYEEPNEDDRMAHLVFGLEQLLLRGESERTYLSYKMALRGAWLLATDAEAREKAYRDLKKAYDLRSKIAHGSFAGDVTQEHRELDRKMESALRQLILRWLETPHIFTPEILNRITLGGTAG